MRIILTGFMGTGKSVVGRRLAERLGLSFLDLDDLIEEEAGVSIPEIFAAEGEPGFRRREREQIARVANCGNCVMATGGGALLDPENIRTLRTGAVLVCLQAAPEVILKRINPESHRPLLQVPDRMVRIRELLDQRASAYAQADLSVETSDSSVEEIVDRIVGHLRQEPARTGDPAR